jgi:hypothetical protein
MPPKKRHFFIDIGVSLVFLKNQILQYKFCSLPILVELIQHQSFFKLLLII